MEKEIGQPLRKAQRAKPGVGVQAGTGNQGRGGSPALMAGLMGTASCVGACASCRYRVRWGSREQKAIGPHGQQLLPCSWRPMAECLQCPRCRLQLVWRGRDVTSPSTGSWQAPPPVSQGEGPVHGSQGAVQGEASGGDAGLGCGPQRQDT